MDVPGFSVRFFVRNVIIISKAPAARKTACCRAIAEKTGLFYTIHLDENLNVSDFNPHVAQAYRRTVEETVALAKALGAPILNMHLSRGVYFTLPDRRVYLFSAYQETYLQSMTAFRQLCEEAIGDSGIKICIENSDGFTDFQKEALRLLLPSPVFGLTFDVGHNHSCGGMDEPYIREQKEKLYHMHLHDAQGGKNHLALGEGELDIPGYLALAKERHCRVVLETKTIAGLRQSVRWLSDQNPEDFR